MHMLDARTVLVSITGMFLGAIPVCISLIILRAVRIIYGGAGLLSSIFIVCSSAAAVLLWRKISITDKSKVSFMNTQPIIYWACQVRLSDSLVFSLYRCQLRKKCFSAGFANNSISSARFTAYLHGNFNHFEKTAEDYIRVGHAQTRS